MKRGRGEGRALKGQEMRLVWALERRERRKGNRELKEREKEMRYDNLIRDSKMRGKEDKLFLEI